MRKLFVLLLLAAVVVFAADPPKTEKPSEVKAEDKLKISTILETVRALESRAQFLQQELRNVQAEYDRLGTQLQAEQAKLIESHKAKGFEVVDLATRTRRSPNLDWVAVPVTPPPGNGGAK